ncbi:MAG TPA: GNAT family N-acetyltransferase [Longilinea sp.]|nr:GNAT family N-acetyltransferase [Longilinea sp.]
MDPEKHLHFLNEAKDLPGISNLIELCFADTMDEDGRAYIRFLRRTAWELANPSLVNSFRPSHRRILGYVWEEDKAIVGNLSLIPCHKEGKPVILVANVAVHPDYRRRGIARMLTKQALTYCQENQAQAAWLHVRDDNPHAHTLYRSLGFVDHETRTTWTSNQPRSDTLYWPEGVKAVRRRSRDWPIQEAWLEKAYPLSVRWNLPLVISQQKPGFWHWLGEIYQNYYRNHWELLHRDEPVGFLTREIGVTQDENLYIVSAPGWEDAVVRTLVPACVHRFPPTHTMSVNVPAGFGEAAFPAVGFIKRNTLIWMEAEIG